MYLGLFDLIGPVMHGPSSNHTGGANRIGYLAHCLMGGTPTQISYGFSPFFYRFYTGHRTHVALTAGCLGLREDDDRSTQALELAAERGISLSYYPIEGEDVDRNAMRVSGRCDGADWEIDAISPGGGSVIIHRINGMCVDLDGGCFFYLYAAEHFARNEAALSAFLKAEGMDAVHMYSAPWGTRTQIGFTTFTALSDPQLSAVQTFLHPCGHALFRRTEPLHPFVQRTSGAPYISSFHQMEEMAKTQPLLELVYAYERDHSGCSRQQVLDEGLRIVELLRGSLLRGRAGDNPLIGGFCSGSDAKAVLELKSRGASLVGDTVNEAIANAIALAERNASAGLIVAAPTAGSAGTLPGTLFAVARHCGADDRKLAEAFLISALLGILVGKDGSFAGSVAGCQVEVGVGAAMAAGASVWLAGGDTGQVINATAIALANCFGLTCDQPVSPVEVPCIKRNAMGASVALMGAELALAGVKSALPMDDVVLGFLDIQKRMPEGTRGGCCGGLAVGEYPRVMRAMWDEKLQAEVGRA